DDPAREIVPPTPPRRLPKALSVPEIEAILHAAGGDGPLALRDRALLEFLYGTGARISEAVGAAIDDLDLDDGSVLLHGKGGRSRLVPVGGYARTAVSAYLVRARPELVRLGHGTPAVFVNARGGPLSRQSAWTILRRAAGGAGLDPALASRSCTLASASQALADRSAAWAHNTSARFRCTRYAPGSRTPSRVHGGPPAARRFAARRAALLGALAGVRRTAVRPVDVP